jgi:hypothetical protein
MRNLERKDEEGDRGTGSGAGQSGRFQKGKGYYGQCVHSGPLNQERIKEERGRMYLCMSVDLRPAFDKVERKREKIFECMKETEE